MNKRVLLVALLAAASAARADWVELTNGTRIDGKIVSMTSQEISIEAQTSPTIRSVKDIPRGEIAKFGKSTADDVAFEEVQKIELPSTADGTAVYDRLIENVQLFMKSYAYSKHMPEARKLNEQLQKDRARLAAGDVKVEGVWVSAQDAQNQPDAGANLALAKMNAAQQDPIAALAAFDAFEKKYSTSAAYPDAIRKALGYIANLRSAISIRAAQVQRRAEEQKNGVALARAENKAQLEQAIKAEADAIKAQIQQAKAAGVKWIPLVDDAQNITEMQQLAQSEESRLRSLNADTLAAGVAAANRAQSELAAGNIAAAQASIEEANRLFPSFAQITTLRTKISQAMLSAPPPTPPSQPATPPPPAPAQP